MNHAKSLEAEAKAESGVHVLGESSQVEFRRMRRLEREDIVILFLSAILIIATLWLASKIL